MDPRRRALIAVQPAAWPRVEEILGDLLDLVPVHTIADAMQVLQSEREKIHLIVSSLTFSDSRALEFLVAVKADPASAGIPFLCCRVRVGILSEHLVESLGRAARLCGATEFVNIGHLPPDEARATLRAAAMRCLSATAAN
ncbi:MAG: hypothetical protein ACT4P4_07995 [Betaproteobacteria bacterium]